MSTVADSIKTETQIETERWLRMYRRMLMIRLFEEQVNDLYTRALGDILYTDYVYPFELAAVILLVAIIAAIALTHRQRKETKHQDAGEQVKVRRGDRVRLVQMAVDRPAPAPVAPPTAAEKQP